MRVIPVEATRLAEAVDVLCDAFADYPVMRFVIGDAGTAYLARLRSMITFFTTARLMNGDIVLGVEEASGALVAAANITRPGERTPPPELAPMRAALWRELGDAALARYEMLGSVWRSFAIENLHYHLNSIGVRRSSRKRGGARAILDTLHAMSGEASDSCGVTLTTEVAENVAFYQRFGYVITGHVEIPGALETWGFFRPDPVARS